MWHFEEKFACGLCTWKMVRPAPPCTMAKRPYETTIDGNLLLVAAGNGPHFKTCPRLPLTQFGPGSTVAWSHYAYVHTMDLGTLCSCHGGTASPGVALGLPDRVLVFWASVNAIKSWALFSSRFAAPRALQFHDIQNCAFRSSSPFPSPQGESHPDSLVVLVRNAMLLKFDFTWCQQGAIRISCNGMGQGGLASRLRWNQRMGREGTNTLKDRGHRHMEAMV